MSDSFQLKAIITAVDQVSGPMKKMQRQLKGFQKEFAGLSLGAAAAGTAMLGALALPVTSAIGFESKMADVRKVVDGLDDKTAFKQMSDDILKLSTELPMAAEGIAEIVAAGGQSGIAREDLKQFATDAIKMAVAFDQTAADSGQMMAQWRTAFKLTQDEVVTLADKINYLGNTGPANAQKISDIVTRIGPLGEVAGVASGEIAAMGATISGMGVESDVAATAVKNFMLSLTAGKAATKSQRSAFKALGIDPKQLAVEMQKDSKSAMLKVLGALSKTAASGRPAILADLFGKESIGAITPLLTNLNLLKENFDKVADSQQYGGSMQKEYASRAATTENSLTLLKGQINAASITLGSIFLPSIVEATKELQPFLESVKKFIEENPDLIKSVVKFSGALIGVGASVAVISRSLRILNAVMNASPAKILITALVAGAYLIIEHWDEVGPVVMKVWEEVDKVAQAMGGWETVLGGIGLYMAGAFTVKTIGSLRTALGVATQLHGILGSIAKMGATTVQIAVAIYMFEKLKEIESAVTEADQTDSFWQSLKNRWSAGGWYNNQQQVQQRQLMIGQDMFSPEKKSNVTLDRITAQKQQSEVKITFENAPPGMSVSSLQTRGSTLMDIKTDVGYNPLLRNN